MWLYKEKVWPVMELAVFKWTSLLVGAIVGAHFSSFVMEYLGVFVALALVGTVRVALFSMKGSR